MTFKKPRTQEELEPKRSPSLVYLTSHNYQELREGYPCPPLALSLGTESHQRPIRGFVLKPGDTSSTVQHCQGKSHRPLVEAQLLKAPFPYPCTLPQVFSLLLPPEAWSVCFSASPVSVKSTVFLLPLSLTGSMEDSPEEASPSGPHQVEAVSSSVGNQVLQPPKLPDLGHSPLPFCSSKTCLVTAAYFFP